MSQDVDQLGVYVHFPWCRKLCPYCDFPVAVTAGEPPHDAYLARIAAELDDRAGDYDGKTLRSIYFGGGTPSLWRPDCIASVIDTIQRRWASVAPIEITLETNPRDCVPDTLAAWRAAGITRLSIGVQSLDPAELIVLGRDHRHGDGKLAIDAALAAGFTALSCDFILGAPVEGTRNATAPGTLAALADTGVDHLSVYELTIEPRTAFGQRARDGRLIPLEEDVLAGQYEAAHALLTARGFDHYEVSSYGKPGRRAVHNSLYWRGVPFLGLGPGAASLWRDETTGRRTLNPRNVAAYLDGAPFDEDLLISAADLAIERLWLGMRTSDGVALADIAKWPSLLSWLTSNDLATIANERVAPTLRGFLLANQIAARIVQCARDGAKAAG